MINTLVRSVFAVLVVVLGTATVSISQTSPSEFPNVAIGNFGKMDDRLFRGAQPEPGQYKALKELGINTVVDLRNDPTDYEKREVEALGMKYVNIPMSGWKYAKDAQVEGFMAIMNDPSNGVIYVHCKAGKHRTGLVGAVYRMEKYGWNYDQVYKEMKNYNYTSWPVHFNIKTYVKDYADEMRTKTSVAAAIGGAATAN